ncbi:ABC-2 type transporter [Ilyonectria robusta]|uniref:ABC-2 type transporter n=1 Tax=Ilyonectria robusta TaxID=1079257 RepID=UPI001E8D5071|nr:ABC-2 type transporter [Ilyonectria robusta]KAH8674955.1 ABC-2 type transporter [Ilyonectria robusta]
MADSAVQPGHGLWGENPQGDVVVSDAIEEFHELGRQLTTKSRLSKAEAPRDDAASGSTRWSNDEFDLPEFLRKGIIDARTPNGDPAKRLGVSFKNLTVRGAESSTAAVKTLPRAILNTFGPDLWTFVRDKIPGMKLNKGPTVNLLHDFTGTVQHGEIMLVLGRPGSGCSTFLKTIANHRDEYVAVEGEVYYGAISADDQKRHFRGEVVYCEEDDRHFPSLTVWQTLWFALKNKTRKKDEWTIPVVLDAFLQMFGIEHTRQTLVGDEHIRGVSGGERKRVSLAETLATRASVVCWDNSTRGLDASTALSFAKALRVFTDVSQRTTLVTLYQAGESIYELMDKVLVIDAGHMLFQGPADEAKKYFEDLGYQCPHRQTTADFLTSISDKNARRFQPGREETTPKTPEELAQAFRQSSHYQRLLADAQGCEGDGRGIENEKHRTFHETVQQSKSKHVTKSSSFTISYPRQVLACLHRQIWLFYHERSSFYTRLFIILSISIIVGSHFIDIDSSATSSAFSKSSMAFFAIAFVGWLQFAELMPAIVGRVTLQRQREFAFCRPSAIVLARAILDLPILFVMVVSLAIPFYFLARFDVDVSKFFIFTLFVYVVSFSLTTMFRMFAAFSSTVDDAIRFVGVFMNIMFIFTGYVIPRSTLLSDVPWFGWFTYINPVSYGFEALQTNEFNGLEMSCSEGNLVPRGPDAQTGYQGCSLPGAAAGSTQVDGLSYLKVSFNFLRSNLWRNFGIVIAFTVFFLILNVVAVEKIRLADSSSQSTVFAKPPKKTNPDEQTQTETDDTFEEIGDGKSVFTFKNINYTVPYGSGQLQLLNSVSGYAKPGKMVALMGTSGAGKTTLLNTLAQRQTVGVISGDMLVNGRPLGEEFQRGTGFCEQRDIHEGSSTIREALEFSALLRQESHVPRSEKIAYVDRIMHLLELNDLEHALISSLTVEQRKRVTIGVELAAKPSLLLFLDEPTSGLDSQSAYSIVRFLRKLCDAGQAIICTIHQPSSDLIEQFDMILALNRGGKTFYFGPVGENGSIVIDYFAARGFHCSPNQNVAEFILETASRPGVNDQGVSVDWNEEWRKSNEAKAIDDEIDSIAAEKRNIVTSDKKPTKFAASTWYQCVLLTKRTFIKHWREPHYVYGRLFIHVTMGIISGFTFWNLGKDVASLQNRMFTAIIYPFFVPPSVVNSVVIYFFRNRDLWEDRELPSCTYGWVAFCTANVLTEIPMSIVSGTLYFLLWYFPTGLPVTASVSGYVYLMTILWSLFMASWGQWIASFGPKYASISNILPFFFCITALVNGVFVPYSALPGFWKYWLYYINPATWLSRGLLSTILPLVSVACSEPEFAHFDPPPGLSCAEYASSFVENIAKAGYLQDPNATSNCGYCPYNDGAEYMKTLNIHAGDKWPCLGYMVVYVVFNCFLVYLFIYTARIKRWTLGFGTLSGWMRGLKNKIRQTKSDQGVDDQV